ncbi:hypothetical protein CRU99_07730 [Malaciobacter mytili]|uniref:hypothetical protein n=1 Tax=Malaciobacter mytili TaxID=603050 RepID=UPI00100BA93B|nr:hypothetical protein [Malaciobacter mytili]RXI43415.1 hypothetical protein CRU99_07730 [Malaciobacter mytili]
MDIKFTTNIYFLWSTFLKKVNLLEYSTNSLIIETKIKKLQLKKNKNSLRVFFLAKYLVVGIIAFLSLSFDEFKYLNEIVFLAPLYVFILYIFSNYWKEIVLCSAIPIISLFYYIDITYFPYFFKYLLISILLIEFYLDIKQRIHYAVYELEIFEQENLVDITNKQINKSLFVSFASINKKSLKGETN